MALTAAAVLVDGNVAAGHTRAHRTAKPDGRQAGNPVPRQNSFSLSWPLRARQAALRYSLIKPRTTCLRLIREVTLTG